MNIEKKLTKAEGGDTAAPKPCLVTVIGVVQGGVIRDLDAPPFTVCTTDAQSGVPTPEQRQHCIDLWAESGGEISTFEFLETDGPSLQREREYQAKRAGRIVPTDTDDKETNA
jgi:hypothetical protein